MNNPGSNLPSSDAASRHSHAARAARLSPAFVRIAPFAAYIGTLAITPLATGLWREAGTAGDWLHTTRGIIAGALLLGFWSRYHELRCFAAVRARDAALVIAAGIAIYAAWIQLDAPWMLIGEAVGFEPLRDGAGAHRMTVTALRLLGLIVIVPVMEELFWRSFLMRWLTDKNFMRLDPRAINRIAFFSTAVLFALEHNLWLAGLVAGVLLNVLYMYSRNLAVPLLAHAVANACLAFHIICFQRWDLW